MKEKIKKILAKNWSNIYPKKKQTGEFLLSLIMSPVIIGNVDFSHCKKTLERVTKEPEMIERSYSNNFRNVYISGFESTIEARGMIYQVSTMQT